MSEKIRRIVIVGGGTAGWITAGLVAARFQGVPGDFVPSITLVESPNVPIIGVGEGTWPTLRGTLKKIGVRETDFIRECDATFKQGAKFCKWTTGAEDDGYYHPLVLPEAYSHANINKPWLTGVAPWLNGDRSEPFAHAVCAQADACERGLAPKTITSPEFDGALNYAYHLNAGKFSSFIQKHCVDNLGVNHVLADMIDVTQDEQGYITSITTEQAGEIKGDLFVDCTGFKSLLLGEAMGVEFKDCSDVLFADTALAVRAPYADDRAPIASHTISTAQEAGWIWDIGLSTRRGIGHVYSSKYIDEDRARQQLVDYLVDIGAKPDELEMRKIPIRSGHRTHFWEKNVVAVGLSAGFLEPLEASAIVLVEMSAGMLSEQMPATRSAMRVIANRFNDIFLYRWERIVDFLKLHYCVTKRTDSQFWIDNADPKTIPDSLLELLELWRDQPPWDGDFVHNEEVFPSSSYQYVLYGMGFETTQSFYGQSDKEKMIAQKSLATNKKRIESLMSILPQNRDLIDKIHKYGLQTV